jgi:hypothetical protein
MFGLVAGSGCHRIEASSSESSTRPDPRVVVVPGGDTADESLVRLAAHVLHVQQGSLTA